MSGQASGALGMAQHLVGKDNVFRINRIVPAGRYGMDALKELKFLLGLGHNEARNEVSKSYTSFLYRTC